MRKKPFETDRKMEKDAEIIFRRRLTDWQTLVFFHTGLPPLEFADLEAHPPCLNDIIKPKWTHASSTHLHEAPHIDVSEGIRIVHEALEGKVGIELEEASASLLLTSGEEGRKNDCESFNIWAAHRTQPLDTRLVDAFARFYVSRLNRILRHVKPSHPKRRTGESGL